jgi:acyltransferase-like protein
MPGTTVALFGLMSPNAEGQRKGEGSWSTQATIRFGDLLRRYHRHQVLGIDNLRRALDPDRPVLLIGNHSMDVTDPSMLRAAIYRETGRLVRFIGHELLFFRLPGIRSFAADAGVIPSQHLDRALRVLREDGMLMLYPGAGSEAALRSRRREPYRLKWYERLGFVELALRSEATLLFVAAVGVDEMFYQTDMRVPSRLFALVDGTYLESYRGLRLEIGSAGLHLIPGIFPWPVKVTHEISRPLRLDRSIDVTDRAALEKAQIRIWAKCQKLLDQAVALRDRRSDWLDAALRRGTRALQTIGL